MKNFIAGLSVLSLMFFYPFISLAQKSKSDSLENIVKTTKDNDLKMKVLNELCQLIYRTDTEKAMRYAKQACELGEKMPSSSQKAYSYTNMGNVYFVKGNYALCLEYYLRSLKIVEELNNKEGIANCYMGLGNVYYMQGNTQEALNYHIKCLKIKEELNDKSGVSGSYLNIANMYHKMGKLDEALDYNQKSLKIRLEMNDYKSLSSSYGNIGLIYFEQGKYDLALEHQLKALEIRTKLNNKIGICSSHINIGNIYEKQGKYNEAIEFHLKGLQVAREIDYKDGVKNAYVSLSNAYENQNNVLKALEYYKLYTQIKDTILNTESTKQIAQMQTLYDTEKKEKEIVLLTKEKEIQELHFQKQETELLKQRLLADKKQGEIKLLHQENKLHEYALVNKESELKRKKQEVSLLNKDKEIQKAEIEQQRMVRNFISGGLIMVLIMTSFIFKEYKAKKKANFELADKNVKIEHAYKIIEVNRDEIAQKNKDIQDSINYAQRIQQAILPSEKTIKELFPQSFVLYKPKDVVSGDFYFFTEKEEKYIAAAVDCTGHGVPGAFMSMISNDQLNQTILENNITEPGDILNRVNKGIKNALRQRDNNSESNDGMDIALISLQSSVDSGQEKENQKPETNNYKLSYAGAHRPLFHLSSGELNVIEADNVAIGGSTSENYNFTQHSVPVKKGDFIYLFSDGYTDQFGGDKGKKFMTKKFKDLLLSIHNKSMDEQKAILEESFETWRGNIEQVDDVLVIGIKI